MFSMDRACLTHSLTETEAGRKAGKRTIILSEDRKFRMNLKINCYRPEPGLDPIGY